MGAIGTVASVLALAWSTTVSKLIVSLVADGSSGLRLGQCIAVGSIAMLGVAVQPMQCGLRALVMDICPAHQQLQAQSLSAAAVAVGQIVGCLGGLVQLSLDEKSDEVVRFRILAILAVAVVSTTTAVTLIGTTKDHPEQTEPQKQSKIFVQLAISRITKTLRNAGRPFHYILCVQAFAWMGWFTFLYYNTRQVRNVRWNFPVLTICPSYLASRC